MQSSQETLESLTPGVEGSESYTVSDRYGAKALAGGGFDFGNPQHVKGSDAVRYAIALQQMRDKKDFDALDAARDFVEQFCFVMQERDGTRVFTKPRGFRSASLKGQANIKSSMRMCVKHGVLYDG